MKNTEVSAVMWIVTMVMIMVLCIVIMICCAGCQSYHKVEYYEDGTLKSEETKEGVPDWSPGKSIQFKGV